MNYGANPNHMYRTAGGGAPPLRTPPGIPGLDLCDGPLPPPLRSGPSLPATGLRSAPSKVGLFLVQNLDHNITKLCVFLLNDNESK
jgi:hypothetical protein